MTHREKAEQLLHQQYHCSQALFGAFAEEFGMDLKMALKLSTCFGGGMRQGGVCGCITASLMVLGIALGFYDSQDRELEIYGNKKTDEFIKLFTERMDGAINCRDILGNDISKPEEMAVIRQEGLILKRCPRALNVSIEILEKMLEEYFKNTVESSIELEDIARMDEMQSMIKNISAVRHFRRNVYNLIFSSSKNIAFIQFDIRKFKLINDLYGEKFGDEILNFIIKRLGEYCHEEQFFINLRSDVFMIVTEYGNEEELTELVKHLDERITNFKNVKLQLSYGIYTVEDKTMELRQMEDRSAMARKAAKNNILTNVVFYKEQFKVSLYNRKFIEENMQSAIAERQFMMYLQPKYSIAKNEIIGAEALVRWRHPERGMIYPNQFIPIIEENGFIKEVDYYIWGEACRFIRRCEEAGIRSCPVSVNVSRVHLQDNECIRMLSEMIDDNHISKELLELEITESADDQQISMKALLLKEAGFTLLMDDFGSGYSSLNILLETPFDVIKLDKKFMENMMVSNKGKLILEQVVLMADKLELGLLAEGVETKEQIDLLENIGCDQVQGYYYAKPMPEEEFFTLLKEQHAAGA
ncbi:MAG: EAL domain-containing protein [Kineothrix sp.]|jgi:C_GCAxxG_C_C family probable redox protein|nr:C_GCAxxG_C_C family protein [Lachnospiraceae bacterium 28-4]MCI8845853.1 EAL domain-containing protein [Lachnospiraceae bacterium]MCX4342939.1 EAL domain-containing protein [Kineothrix sp.]